MPTDFGFISNEVNLSLYKWPVGSRHPRHLIVAIRTVTTGILEIDTLCDGLRRVFAGIPRDCARPKALNAASAW